MNSVGFTDYRITKQSKITIQNKDIELILGDIKFYSITVRAFKLADLEDKCEDYGQSATYLGTIDEHPDKFVLDSEHEFKKD